MTKEAKAEISQLIYISVVFVYLHCGVWSYCPNTFIVGTKRLVSFLGFSRRYILTDGVELPTLYVLVDDFLNLWFNHIVGVSCCPIIEDCPC